MACAHNQDMPALGITRFAAVSPAGSSAETRYLAARLSLPPTPYRGDGTWLHTSWIITRSAEV